MRNVRLRYGVVLAYLLAAGVLTSQAAQKPAASRPGKGVWKLKTIWQVGGEGRWDYVTVDPSASRLYVPRSTHVQVLDTNTGKVIGDIPDTAGVHGVALVPDVNRGFTSNGRAGTVTVFDLKTLKVEGTVKVGQNPDDILYDPHSRKVFAFNGRSNDATVIDPTADATSAAVMTIPLGGKPEAGVSDEKGRVYVNLEDKSEIAVIDTNAMKVTATWNIDGGQEPSGLALDKKHQILFAGCGGNNVMAFVDAKTGRTLGKPMPIGKGVDGCAFDPGTGEAFASCGDGTLWIVKELPPYNFIYGEPVSTRPGARTLALDPTGHAVYLPTAAFEPAKPGERRPAMKPDSFMIVVVTLNPK